MQRSPKKEVKIHGNIVLHTGSYQNILQHEDTLQVQFPGKIWSAQTPDRPIYINPNTLLCHYGHAIIVAEPWYGL